MLEARSASAGSLEDNHKAENKSELPAQSITSTKLPSIDALTGLRFIAAMLVYLYHLTAFSPGLPEWLQTFMSAGFNGVSLFFTLSGFVICYNYYNKMTTRPRSSLWPYFVSRFARVYPMHFFTFLYVFSTVNLSTQLQTKSDQILQQLTLTQAWNPDRNAALSFNGPAWSVSVEIFLYLCFPPLAYLILRKCQKIWQLLLLGVLAIGSLLLIAAWVGFTNDPTVINSKTFRLDTNYWFYRFPVTHLADFVLGCVAARIYMLRRTQPVTPRENRLGAGVLVLSIAAIIFFMIFDQPGLLTLRLGSIYVPFFAIAIYCLARYQTYLSRLLSHRLFILLGEASYSFYLLQIVTDPYKPRLATPGEPGTYLYGLLIWLGLILLSLGAYTYVESPLRRWIRKLALARKPSQPLENQP
jgi:peptidoglycan/LPS O-acetylase OafA/YrhL